ncbi:MAG: histidine triad protein, partial [Actinomycetia bacterium]|nr:histidine triad protein [Actinomycetes bacterium]
GDIPATKVLETDRSLAFRDLNPQAPTHVLVIPKEHVTHAGELTADHGELLADLFATAAKVAEQEGVAEGGYRLVFNIGEDSGNSVPHLHLHVLGGRKLGWPPG